MRPSRTICWESSWKRRRPRRCHASLPGGLCTGSHLLAGKAVLSVAADQLTKLLKRDLVIYPAKGNDLDSPSVYRVSGSSQSSLISENEKAVAVWALRNNKHAGATTDTLSSAQCLYLAIRVNERVYGVVGISMVDGKPLDAFENSVLLSILGECALALENIKNAKEKEEAAVMAKNEKLRANLLRAISHDLRTPLASISGNAGSLLPNYQKMDEQERVQAFTDIYDDAMWLDQSGGQRHQVHACRLRDTGNGLDYHPRLCPLPGP